MAEINFFSSKKGETMFVKFRGKVEGIDEVIKKLDKGKHEVANVLKCYVLNYDYNSKCCQNCKYFKFCSQPIAHISRNMAERWVFDLNELIEKYFRD